MATFFKCFFFCLFITCSGALAQEVEKKYEREKRIKKDKFPEKALAALKPIVEKSKKIRFYKEYDQADYFYEYKASFNKKPVSIKFDEEGVLIDLEVREKFVQLPNSIQEEIESYFKNQFKKHKIKKVQLHFDISDPNYLNQFKQVDDESILLMFVENNFEFLEPKYELEAEVVKNKDGSEMFEFLFDSGGKIERTQKIIQRSDDNILY